MKKSYLKLLIFYLIVIGVLLVNSLVVSFLNKLCLVILLLFLIILTKLLFGFEKDKHRYIKDVIIETIIMLIIFFILYYLFGIVISFSKTANYFNLSSLLNIFVPTMLYIIFKEFLRYQTLTKSGDNKLLFFLNCLLFIVMDNALILPVYNLAFNRTTFIVFALYLLPSITENILCFYLSKTFGYKPSIIYLLVIKLYIYVLPIVPNPSEFVYSLIFFLLPLIFILRYKKWLLKDKVNSHRLCIENDGKTMLLSLIPVILLVAILTYFLSGYFKYYVVAIASGSMTPSFYKGDAVIIDQKYKSDDLIVGTVIAYRHNNKIMVHRINKIINADRTYIYTKGDANENVDDWKVTNDDVLGVVKIKLPFIGYPTVWLNENW